MFSKKIYDSWRTLQYEKFAFLLDKFPSFFSGRVLDVGCGENFLREFLQEKDVVASTIGVDLDQGDVIADANSLPFRDATFSRIICVDALHLFENDSSRLLKKGGLFLTGTFFNDANYNKKREMLARKLAGLEILEEVIFPGKEKEIFILAKRL